MSSDVNTTFEEAEKILDAMKDAGITRAIVNHSRVLLRKNHDVELKLLEVAVRSLPKFATIERKDLRRDSFGAAVVWL